MDNNFRKKNSNKPIQQQPTSTSPSSSKSSSKSSKNDEQSTAVPNSSKQKPENNITNTDTEKPQTSPALSQAKTPLSPTNSTSSTQQIISPKEKVRLDKFTQLLSHKQLEMSQLRKNAWSGVPALKRGQVWRLLCGYEPSSLDRRRTALTRKRNEYKALIDRYFEPRNDPEHSHTEI